MSRRLDIGLRSSLLLALGIGLLALPFLTGLGPAAAVAGTITGALALTVGVAGTGQGGRGTVSATAHAAFDRGLGGGLLVAALAFGVAGQRGALALFGLVGLALLAIAAATRYTVSTASS